MHRIFVVGACAASLLLSPALVAAQVAPQASPHDTASAGSVALVPTPAALALADTLLRENLFEEVTRASAMATYDVSVQQQPAMAMFRDVMEAWVIKYMSLAEMGPTMSRLYAETFTEDELRALVAFYRTPVGRQLARMTPKLAERGALLGAAVAQRHAGELEQQMRGRMAELQASGNPPE